MVCNIYFLFIFFFLGGGGLCIDIVQLRHRSQVTGMFATCHVCDMACLRHGMFAQLVFNLWGIVDKLLVSVFRKMQCSLLPHPLDSLKLPQLEAYRSTRQSSASHQHTVVIPKSRTSQHQRSFSASYARLWNSLPASVVDVPFWSVLQI